MLKIINIKIISTTIIFLGIVGFTNAQCGCNRITRYDGLKLVQCDPSPIGRTPQREFAISLTDNGLQRFVSITTRFLSGRKEVESNLYILFENGIMVEFELINQAFDLIGGSTVNNSIYLIEESDYGKIKSKIKTITLKYSFEDKITFQPELNADIISKQFDCVSKM